MGTRTGKSEDSNTGSWRLSTEPPRPPIGQTGLEGYLAAMKETAHKVVSLGTLPGWFIERYLEGFETVVIGDSSRKELDSHLDASVVALIARGSLPIGEDILQAAPSLRAIGRTGVGFDSIDVAAASARHIPVLFTPGAMTEAVAEHTLAMILSLCKDLSGWKARVLAGDWQSRYTRRNLDLKGARVGIVGCGRIGSRVWRLLKSFGALGLINDPYIDPEPLLREGVGVVSLEELLQHSDIVTLHTPLTDETRSLVNRSSISLFRPGALLINAARGKLVESYDLLLEALESGRLGGVALDTLIEEPPDPSHPLFRHPGLLLSAHVAARTNRAQESILCTLGEDLRAVLEGKPPRKENVVNPEILRE